MPLTDQLDRLAKFEPVPYPVVSLYLNTQPNEQGRDQFQTFIRQEFKSRSQTYPPGSPDRVSLDKDLERIASYLENDLQPSANGVAVFACDAAGLFETVQLNAPIDQHWLYIGDTPHLYPLARVESRFPRYAAVVADTNTARIMVFATGELQSQAEVKNEKTRRTSQGGWSQARFQRNISNQHQQHVKEVVDALDRIVTQEGIEQILTVGDEVVLPILRDQLPKHLADKVVDHLKIDSKAPVDEILAATVEAMGRLNQQSDKDKVEAAIGGHRGGNLGVVGPEATLEALIKGQVDELLLSGTIASLKNVSPRAAAMANDSTLMDPAVETAAGGEAAQADPQVVRLADELVTRATNTSAKVTIIEDPELLQPHGGVAALLRFRI
ncbi:MAG TPA: Vms1/Ankzf1 family peptidyl-tRNA hydrolase [Vicinamibacterales bacterium]|nr:Vms1/Ankzf1 family peptidyl-tRNA hydrolase [Vicinamibacterales bacterium]